MTTLTPHPNDKLAALDWAISQARSAERQDTWVGQTIVCILLQMRDDILRNAELVKPIRYIKKCY